MSTKAAACGRNAAHLTYLNNRYYDPGIGVFTSVDPLVGKTGTPYLYGNGNPATLSDPSGLAATCASVDGGGCHSIRTTKQTKMYQANLCILSAGCSGQKLVDAIELTKADGIGGLVFAMLDGADVGGKIDGNWGRKGFEAALDSTDGMLRLLNKSGVDGTSADAWAAVAQSVAGRLLGDPEAFKAAEEIDHEKTWYERWGGKVTSVIAAVADVVATIGSAICLTGAALACGIAGAASLVGLAADGLATLMSCPGSANSCGGSVYGLAAGGVSYGTTAGMSAAGVAGAGPAMTLVTAPVALFSDAVSLYGSFVDSAPETVYRGRIPVLG